MRRTRVIWMVDLARTDRVREAAAAALADPRLAASPEVAAMVADCAERPGRYLEHAPTLAWGCCDAAYVADADDARTALAVFVHALREAEQVAPGEDGRLQAE